MQIFLIPLLKCYLELSLGRQGSVLFLKQEIINLDHFCSSKMKSMSNSPFKKVLNSILFSLLSQNLGVFHDSDDDNNGDDFENGSKQPLLNEHLFLLPNIVYQTLYMHFFI